MHSMSFKALLQIICPKSVSCLHTKYEKWICYKTIKFGSYIPWKCRKCEQCVILEARCKTCLISAKQKHYHYLNSLYKDYSTHAASLNRWSACAASNAVHWPGISKYLAKYWLQQYLLFAVWKDMASPTIAGSVKCCLQTVIRHSAHKLHIACKHRPTHDFVGLIVIKMKTPTGAISCRANFRLPARRPAPKWGSHLNYFTVIWPQALHILQSEMEHECRIASVGT